MSWYEMVIYSLLLYGAASLRVVGPTEQGCILLFGRPWRLVTSGLRLVPFGFCWLVTETILTIQDELPTDPEKIYRSSPTDEDGSSMSPELQAAGMRPPIRVTFGDRNATESASLGIDAEDPYDRRLTAEVVPVIRWRIENFQQFLQTIGSVDEARRQMEDTCIKVFTEHLTQVSPAVAMKRIGSYSKTLEDALDTLVKSWGIDVVSAEIKAIRFSRSLNAAVQNAVVQERNKKAAILEGQGLGGKQKAILDGRTDGLKKMRDDLGVDGAAVLGAETARSIAGEGDKSSQRTIIAGSGGFADLIGTAVAVGESLKKKE